MRGWGCREGCRLGILKCGGEGGGEGEGGGGDGGAVGEGDEVDDVLGALKLWGADGALAVLSACTVVKRYVMAMRSAASPRPLRV